MSTDEICGYCRGSAVLTETGYVHGDDTVTPPAGPGDFVTGNHRPGTRINPVDVVERDENDEDEAPNAEHDPRVTVWANGFGVWHVRVSRSAAGPLIAARRVLRDELTARESNVSRDVWMHPVEVPELSDADSIVYRENTDSGCSCGQADKGAPGHETH